MRRARTTVPGTHTSHTAEFPILPSLPTAEKRLYAEMKRHISWLEERYARCERLSIANNFAAAVMHEVNNPLEAINNLVYLAQMEEPSAPLKDYLEQIHEQMVMLTAIARSSLSFYRGQDTPRDLDLVHIAECALRLHSTRLKTAGVRVRTRYCSEPAFLGIASETLQVISNLILNAADALSATPNGEIRISVHRTRSWLHFAISDDGPGIPDDVRKRLFQAHSTSKNSGMGMGLWLSRRIVTQHGGCIRYRTSARPGKSGTVFSVTLPRLQAA